MPEYLVNLLVQIPLVGVFIWFILERDKRSDAALSERDKQWREFLAEQREQNNNAISRLAEEIKGISSQVSSLNGIISAHDAASRERISGLARKKV